MASAGSGCEGTEPGGPQAPSPLGLERDSGAKGSFSGSAGPGPEGLRVRRSGSPEAPGKAGDPGAAGSAPNGWRQSLAGMLF